MKISHAWILVNFKTIITICFNMCLAKFICWQKLCYFVIYLFIYFYFWHCVVAHFWTYLVSKSWCPFGWQIGCLCLRMKWTVQPPHRDQDGPFWLHLAGTVTQTRRLVENNNTSWWFKVSSTIVDKHHHDNGWPILLTGCNAFPKGVKLSWIIHCNMH